MQTVNFTPDHAHTYQATVERLTVDDHTIRFGFGYGGAITAVEIATDGQPNSFGRFCTRWNSPAIAGDGPMLWAGFMALRYVLGYFSQWELLPPAIRAQAWRPTAVSVTPPPALVAAIRGWECGWEHSLQPLCDAVRPPAIASAVGGRSATQGSRDAAD